MVKDTQKLCWLLSTKNLSVFEHFVELALKGLVWKMLLGEYFQFEPRIFLHSQYLYIQYRDSVLRKMWDCKYCFSISLSRRFFNPISNPIHTTIITKKRFLKSNLRSESKFSYLHARHKTWKKWMSCFFIIQSHRNRGPDNLEVGRGSVLPTARAMETNFVDVMTFSIWYKVF